MRLLRLIALASGAAATVSSDIVRKQQEDGAGDDGEENGTERDPFRRRGMQQGKTRLLHSPEQDTNAMNSYWDGRLHLPRRWRNIKLL